MAAVGWTMRSIALWRETVASVFGLTIHNTYERRVGKCLFVFFFFFSELLTADGQRKSISGLTETLLCLFLAVDAKTGRFAL